MTSRVRILLAVFLIFRVCGLAEGTDSTGSAKLAVPKQESIDAAIELIKQAYEDDFKAAKDTGDIQPCLTKLSSIAEETKDATRKYALLVELEAVAVESGDLGSALTLFESRQEQFEFDGLKERLALLARFARRETNCDQELFEQVLGLTEIALDAERFDVAQETPEVAIIVAKSIDRNEKARSRSARLQENLNKSAKAKGQNRVQPTDVPQLLNVANNLANEIAQRKKQYENYTNAVGQLSTAADNADANRVVGRYRCMVQGDWKNGLAALSKGQLQGVSEVARKELALNAENVSDAESLFIVAGDWWKLADDNDRFSKQESVELRAHAVKLYSAIAESLTDPIFKALASKRSTYVLYEDVEANRASGIRLGVPRKLKKTVLLAEKFGKPLPGMVAQMRAFGYEVTQSAADISAKQLEDRSILMIVTGSDSPFSPLELIEVRKHVISGGGLLCAGQAWSWNYKAYGNKPIETFPLNVLGRTINFSLAAATESPAAPTIGIFQGVDVSMMKSCNPSLVKASSQKAEVTFFSNDRKPLPIAVRFSLGRGEVLVFGHQTMLQSPEVLRRSLEYLTGISNPSTDSVK